MHFRSDSAASVDAVERRLARNDVLLRLLRALHYEEARGGFRVSIEHLKGELNAVADALSRQDIPRFVREFRARYGIDPAPEMTSARYPSCNVHND